METVTLKTFEGHTRLAEAREHLDIARKAYEEALERYIGVRHEYTKVLEEYFPAQM